MQDPILTLTQNTLITPYGAAADGVTEFDAADIGLLPTLVIALTVQV
jgi:hypothetical protein